MAWRLARFQSITPPAACLVAEEDVLGDRQVGDQRELLVDDHDAGCLAVADVRRTRTTSPSKTISPS